MSLPKKILFNLQWRWVRLYFRLFGNTLRCSICGGDIAPVIPKIRNGALFLKGLDPAEVTVCFDGRMRLVFQHYDRDLCQAHQARISPRS